MLRFPVFAVTCLLIVLPVFAATYEQKQQLGMQLFFDVSLSANRTQSCATCHQPDRAFIDPRGIGVEAAASRGDDGHSLGDRNTPTASYAATIPAFHRKENGVYAGGLFWDGRANSLADQAAGPPLNPIEMGMANESAVAARLQENPGYVEAFKRLYGEAVFTDPGQAYAAMTDALAAFEQTDFFAPYDSKYDRQLRGEYEFTPEEELGRTLFFSQQFTNCNQCHQLQATPNHRNEVFSNFEYHNIGVPPNKALRAVNGVSQVDEGLLLHPEVNDPAQRGKFRTPTLRNVAVTAPYMHNGVFSDLRTVVLFYNKYNSRAARRQINPETGEGWAEPEVPQNLSMELLEIGPALDDRRVDALVAFLKTLTDQRYEHLLGAQ
jgi:cytochrome c peroxidase